MRERFDQAELLLSGSLTHLIEEARGIREHHRGIFVTYDWVGVGNRKGYVRLNRVSK